MVEYAATKRRSEKLSPDTVASSSHFHRCWVANAAELQWAVGVPPREKYVRYIPTMQVMSEEFLLTIEIVWTFAWGPASAVRLRCTEIGCIAIVDRKEVLFSHEAHAVPRHAARAPQQGFAARFARCAALN